MQSTTGATPTILHRYQYSYDPAGNRLTEQRDDTVTGWTFDSLNRLVTQSTSGSLRVAGTLSEPATVTVNGLPARVDGSNQFVAPTPVTSGTNTLTISATDPTGNNTTKVYTISQGTGTKTFTFDANGNLTSDSNRTFEWDAEDQLVAINQGSHRSAFSYDGAHRRSRIIEKENGTVVSDQPFIWLGNEIGERRTVTGSTGTTRAYRFALQDGGSARYLTRDQLLSVHEVTDDSAVVQARYKYEPFGAVTKTGFGADFFEYTGSLVHQASGLFLMQRRAYDTGLARWLSEDPIGLKSGPNLYAYVVNNPLRWIDPEGTQVVMPRPGLPNGNMWGEQQLQDNTCTSPASMFVIGGHAFNSMPCVKKCCQVHDDCYAASRCNWTSWLTIAYDSACTRCNRTVVMCVLWADPNPNACPDCGKR